MQSRGHAQATRTMFYTLRAKVLLNHICKKATIEELLFDARHSGLDVQNQCIDVWKVECMTDLNESREALGKCHDSVLLDCSIGQLSM